MWLTLPKHSQLETDTLTITVKDGVDAISGATVTINNDSKITDSDGKATFELPYGNYTTEVTVAGYDNAEESIAFRSNHKNFTITMTEHPTN